MYFRLVQGWWDVFSITLKMLLQKPDKSNILKGNTDLLLGPSVPKYQHRRWFSKPHMSRSLISFGICDNLLNPERFSSWRIMSLSHHHSFMKSGLMILNGFPDGAFFSVFRPGPVLLSIMCRSLCMSCAALQWRSLIVMCFLCLQAPSRLVSF